MFLNQYGPAFDKASAGIIEINNQVIAEAELQKVQAQNTQEAAWIMLLVDELVTRYNTSGNSTI